MIILQLLMQELLFRKTNPALSSLILLDAQMTQRFVFYQSVISYTCMCIFKFRCDNRCACAYCV